MKNLVWLASYPRSGNTWFRIVLSQLLSGKKENPDLNNLEINMIANARSLFDEFAGLDSANLTINEINNLRPAVYQLLSDEMKELFFLKTHDRFLVNQAGKAVFPADCSYGCIYFVRNPFDTAVSNSFYFHKDMDAAIEQLNDQGFVLHASVRNLVPVLEEKLGTWSEHVLSWCNSRLRVHVMRYEDMVANPFSTFSMAFDFLDLHFSDKEIIAAIAATSFQNLQQSEKQNGFREKLQNCDSFFRAGKAGGWQSVLSEKQVSKILAEHHNVMTLFGYL